MRSFLSWFKKSLPPRSIGRRNRPSRRAAPHLEALEDRVVPVVGAAGFPPTVAAGTGFDGVVRVFAPNGGGTGSLLSSGRHILTAAHVVDGDVDSNGDGTPDQGDGRPDAGSYRIQFDLPGRGPVSLNVPASSVEVLPAVNGRPAWNGRTGSGSDLAVITLPEIAPLGAERYGLYRSSDEVSQVFTFVGYGGTNQTRTNPGGTVTTLDGTAGHDGSYGTKRLGQNRFDAVAVNASALRFDFDSASAADSLGVNEANTAPGDSGGPSFLGGLIAAVTSNGSNANAAIGDVSLNARVSPFVSWIDGILARQHGLVLDMNNQPGANDGTADTIEARVTPGLVGPNLELWINGRLYHSDPLALVSSVTIFGSNDRDVITVPTNFQLSARDFTVYGRGGSDDLIISDTGSATAYNVADGVVSVTATSDFRVNYSSFESLRVNAGSGDTVTVAGTSSATPVTVRGADTVLVGSGSKLTEIRSAVTIENPPSYTALTVDDSADPTFRNVTHETVSISGSLYGRISFGGVPIQYKYADTSRVTLNTGSGGAQVNVLGTSTPLTLNGGGAADTFNVQGASGALTINSGFGPDTINVGNGGSLDAGARVEVNAGDDNDTIRIPDARGLAGQLTVNGGAGTLDRLEFNDSQNIYVADTVVTINQSSVTRSGIATKLVSYSNVEDLTVTGGYSHNIFKVDSTPAGTQVTVNAGPGNDAVNIANPAQVRSLLVVGNIGTALVVDDQSTRDVTINPAKAYLFLGANNVRNVPKYTVTGQTVTWSNHVTETDPVTGVLQADYTTTGSISYRNLANLTIQGGSPRHVFEVLGTAAGTRTTVNAASTGDQVLVGGSSGLLRNIGDLTVNGATGTTLTLDDHNDRDVWIPPQKAYLFLGENNVGTEPKYVITGQAVTRQDRVVESDSVTGNVVTDTAYTTTINYRNVASLSIQGGSSNNVFQVQAAVPALLTIDAGAGNDIVVGGAGNETIRGNTGRDLLIAGIGADLLDGGTGEDIVIGGSTAYDANTTALTALMAEWGRTDLGYAARLDHLLWGGGLNGSTRLDFAAVTSNGGVNTLTGGTVDLDLFYGSLARDGRDWDRAAGEKFIDPTAGRLDEQLGLWSNGNLSQNWGGRNEKWLQGASNEWYFLLPNGDLYRWDGSAQATGTLVGQVGQACYNDPSLLYEAHSGFLAAQLDRSLGLYTTGNLYQNWGGRNEKWLQGTGGTWYFILANGELYRWDGSAQATGTLVGRLDPSYYLNVSKLTEAGV